MEMDTSIPGGGAFRIDTSVSSRGFTIDSVPKAGNVGYLDPEVTGEGIKIQLSDGSVGTFTPPHQDLAIPDWSKVKQLQKYFNRTDRAFFPTWLYHPTEEPVIAKNAKESWEEFGVRLKESSEDEQAKYGAPKYVWDWKEDSKWRPKPYAENPAGKFNPAKAEQGKTYVPAAPNPVIAQNELLAQLVPLVTAAVVTGLRSDGRASAPAQVDSADWDDYLQFKAWKKSNEAVGVLSSNVAEVPSNIAGGGRSADAERAEWEAKAKEASIKIDGRWSVPKLRDHVVSELQKRVQEAELRESEKRAAESEGGVDMAVF